jgi:hypothetical protein
MFKSFTFLMGIFSQYNNIYSQEVCLGDIDNNLSVDVNDLLGVLSNFGSDCNNDPLIIPEPVETNCVLGDDCGGQVWTECGTSCPPICGSPEPMICNMMCNVGYQCPQGLWWDNDTGNCVLPESCYEPISLPPDIAIGRPFIKNNSNIHSLIVYEKNDWNEVF